MPATTRLNRFILPLPFRIAFYLLRIAQITKKFKGEKTIPVFGCHLFRPFIFGDTEAEA